MPSTPGLLDREHWTHDDAESQVGSGPDWAADKSDTTPDAPSRGGLRGRALSRVRSWVRPWSKPSPQRLHPTAYLDGLRGFAALLVYWHHHQLWAHAFQGNQASLLENGFGYDNAYLVATLPGIRTFFTGGHYAVSVFFVISGYVLSIKPLGLLQSGRLMELGDHVASALFRRWPRLFLPVMAIMLPYAMFWHASGMWIHNATPRDSWTDELWSFYCEFKNFSFVYNGGGVPWITYNVHSWSIPVEFRGSLVVYGAIMALSRCSTRAHLWCEAGLVLYFLYVADGWFCAMFVSGMLIRHLDLLAQRQELPGFLARLEPAKTFICYHLLALSIYLGGVPSENQDVDQLGRSRGWYWLSLLKPQAMFDYKWFYLFWAATLLVAALPRIRWLRALFESRPCQYLGRISYSLYLVHGPVLSTLGDRLYAAVGWHGPKHLEHMPQWVDRFPLPRSGPMGLEVAFVVPHLVLLPLTMLLADVATRTIDKPSVRLAGWMYRQVSAEPLGPGKAKA